MSDATSTPAAFDLLIRGATVYDGSGGAPVVADVAVSGDRIATLQPPLGARAAVEIDARGLAVSPGFINPLSHSYITMLHDGRSLSELMQGVTTQVFGEGTSMGPLNDAERERLATQDPALSYEVAWTGLVEYLEYAEKRGIAQNVASYIGATTLRINVAGHADRPLTDAELNHVRGMVRDEMSAGAIGIGSSLIYPPAFFATTEELIEMCRAAAPFGGRYISHMRNEGLDLLGGIAELARIAREADVPAEIFHLKASGRDAWHLMQPAIDRIEAARAEGLAITADMYPYAASSTGLWSCIPPWYHEGGPAKLFERLQDPSARAAIREEMLHRSEGWSNHYQGVGGGDGILVLATRTPELRRYQGMTLTAIAHEQGTNPEDALMDLVLADRSRVGVAYFSMSEENVRLGLAQPWVSLGSDAASMAAEGAFLTRATHPRAYGTYARFLGKYVRGQQVTTLPDAIRRLTRLPADNLGLDRRGRLEPGYFADIVVFDPATIADRATFDQPHQYAVGVRDVIVNGTPALRDGAFADAYPGRALYGPGRR